FPTASALSTAPGEYALEVFHVVHHAPLGRTSVTRALLPPLESAHVAARIDIVGAELGDVERDNPNAVEFDREVAHGLVVQLLLHIREDNDCLSPSACFVEELCRLN